MSSLRRNEAVMVAYGGLWIEDDAQVRAEVRLADGGRGTGAGSLVLGSMRVHAAVPNPVDESDDRADEAGLQPHRQLTRDELVSLGDYVEREFLIPFLVRRAETPADWGLIPVRISLTPSHQRILADALFVDSDSTMSWRALARRRQTDVSTLTRQYRRAQIWLATARFLLFANSDRWNVGELLLSGGDPAVRARLEAEADAQCDVFDQTYRARFAPHMPVPLRQDDPRRLGDHHKNLLGHGARSLAGARALYLNVQGATGRRSTVDLTPRLEFNGLDPGSLAAEEASLHVAVDRFDELAAMRLDEVRRTGRTTS